jgi:lysophospholipase L1-like esterase
MNAKHIIFAAIVIAGSFFVAFALFEGTLRLFPVLLPVEIRPLTQARQSDFGVAHPYIGHLHKPNNSFELSGRDFSAVHHTDGHGFRNPWPWPEKVEIVALGDSVTFGQTVKDEEAWPALLARSLPQSRVINLGLIGAGLQQYLRVYETFGVKLRPKLVLVGLFIRNDFWDDGLFDEWQASGAGGNYMFWRDGGEPRKKGEDLIADVKDSLRASYSFIWLRHVRNTLRGWLLSTIKTFRCADGSQLVLLPGDFIEKTLGATPERREFQVALGALKRIHAIAAENGARMLVILQPSKEEVYLPLLGAAILDAAGPLRQALERSGIDYLDLTPGFRERARTEEKLFQEVDGHPNARGYALIAELVHAHLKSHAGKYGL